MKKLFGKLSFLAALFCLLVFLSVAALAEEAIVGAVEITPNNLTGPGTVTVNIQVSNIGDDPEPVSVQLVDPNADPVLAFGTGSVVHLKAGESRTYSGNWPVTAEQLEKGRVTYTLRYTAVTPEGSRTPISRPIYAPITHTSAQAVINLNRQTPSGAVVEGQNVRIDYIVSNRGGVDLTDVTIEDPDITAQPLLIPLLRPGEELTVSANYVAGATSRTSQISMSYSYVENGETVTKTIQTEPKAIAVTVPDVSLVLTASQSIVNKGDTIDLVLDITNRGSLTYSNVTITDPLIGTVEPGLTLQPNNNRKVTRTVTVDASNVYRFTLTAKDSTGADVTFISNECSVQTIQDQGSAVTAVGQPQGDAQLTLLAEADRPVIYSEPSDIVFQIKVTNNGLTAVQDVAVAAVPPEGGTAQTLRVIESLEPGASVTFAKLVQASMGGQYQFRASIAGAAEDAAPVTFESVPVQVTFQVTSAPPTPTPEPTPPPTEVPTPGPTESVGASPWSEDESVTDTGGPNRTLLYILAGVLGAVIVAVIALFWLDTRRKQSQAGPSGYFPRPQGPATVIDSFQRTERRDYSRASRHPAPRPRARAVEPVAQPESAPTPQPVGMETKRVPRLRIEEVPPAETAPDVNPYRRPKTETPEAAPAEEPAREGTEAPGQAYLTRIRRVTAARAAAEGEENTEKADLSRADAALLSGSTGEYRLSRKSGIVREPGAQASARDGGAHGERLRGENSGAKRPPAFYDDEEGGEA